MGIFAPAADLIVITCKLRIVSRLLYIWQNYGKDQMNNLLIDYNSNLIWAYSFHINLNTTLMNNSAVL